jgi:hypothetical protein
VIHVARPSESDKVKEALLWRDKAGLTEREAAEAYYGATPPPTSGYPFKRYKAPAVCAALDEIFHEKCAYCESSYRALEARNVEHYRPKGPVKEANGTHPGYWWLAAVWTNLLPSCPVCNQLRRHVVYDPNMTLAEFEATRLRLAEQTTGKLDSFPVAGNNWLCVVDGDLSDEDPLLLNPCECRPDDHLEWNFDWDRSTPVWIADRVTALARPRTRSGVEDPYGRTSIAVYGLNREGLVKDRMLKIKELQQVCAVAVDLFVTIGEVGEMTPMMRTRLADVRTRIESFGGPDRPYAGMARAFARLFLRELDRLKHP